jgi:hypothetical protein
VAAVAPAVARPSPVVVVPSESGVPSFDGDIPFDGARRRRRVGILFAIFLVIVFGALFGALLSSRLAPR